MLLYKASFFNSTYSKQGLINMVAGCSWSQKIRTATQHSGVCVWSYQNLKEASFVIEEVTIPLQKN